MATLVKVRKWGNSLGVRLPKSFTSERAIVDGATVEIDSLTIIDARPRRRSGYKLANLLKNYKKPPKNLDFPPTGKEMA
jgi:antitoxin component of MazEF toxin-antitoxin module